MAHGRGRPRKQIYEHRVNEWEWESSKEFRDQSKSNFENGRGGTEAEEREKKKKKLKKKKTHLACQRGPVAMRQPTYALAARAALNVLLGNHWNFTADRII